MDPNAALAELRELLREGDVEISPEEISQAIDLFQGLDDWLSGGGFLPRAWQREDSTDGGPRLCGCGARHDVHTDEDDD